MNRSVPVMLNVVPTMLKHAPEYCITHGVETHSV